MSMRFWKGKRLTKLVQFGVKSKQESTSEGLSDLTTEFLSKTKKFRSFVLVHGENCEVRVVDRIPESDHEH